MWQTLKGSKGWFAQKAFLCLTMQDAGKKCKVELGGKNATILNFFTCFKRCETQARWSNPPVLHIYIENNTSAVQWNAMCFCVLNARHKAV